MQNFVKIKKGTYRNAPIKDAIFPVVKPITFGKKGSFITVDGSSLMGASAKKIRVLVASPLDVTPSTKGRCGGNQRKLRGKSKIMHRSHPSLYRIFCL